MQKGLCKHFNGTVNDKCRAGIIYQDVTPDPGTAGSALRLPCRSVPGSFNSPSQLEHFNRRGTCAKYEEPTNEELAEYWRRSEEMFARHAKAMTVIAKVKKEHKGQIWQGVEVCPVCGGKLHMSHAAVNGHVWGRCETKDCLSWME